MPKSRNVLSSFLEENYLDKTVLIISLRLVPKIQDF